MANNGMGWRLAQVLDLVGGQGLPPDAQGRPVRNAPSPLGVFVPFIRDRGLRRRRRVAREQDQPRLHSAQLILPPLGGWHSSGLNCEEGERFRISASGQIYLNKALEVSVGPRAVLWYRFGDGPITRMTRDEEFVRAKNAGELKLQINLPGSFEPPQGELSDDCPPPPMTGELRVEIERLGSEVEEQESPSRPPPGWKYLDRLGNADIFHRCDQEQAICCQTHGDVGILQFKTDLPLSNDLTFDWDWLVEELPSQLPEHARPTHDYLSIAVEFDNGLDLTYMWSASLSKGTIFQCPLPWWDLRETHWVLRTPEDGLEQWHSESRPIRADYIQAIGGEVPERVVGVWLIANSAFQGGRGVCRYRQIALRLENAETLVPI